ncbi:MAG TPA: peptidylprolyl isomerase [Firmicutes bacterium]|nr:peptidylprolyl isomerase [Bacillota bacterium]
MAKAKSGDKVKVHYKGTLDDGSVFDSSEGKEPLEFEVGAGTIIPGFEKGVEGLEPGGKNTIKIAPEEAYGPVSPDAVIDIPRDKLPEGMEPKKEQTLEMQSADGRVIYAVLKDVAEDKITVDANHPLAGKELTFEIELVEIA